MCVFYEYNVEIKLKVFICIYELIWLIDICWIIIIKSVWFKFNNRKKSCWCDRRICIIFIVIKYIIFCYVCKYKRYRLNYIIR